MTTPENLKKRQERILKLLRLEGLILAFVLVVVGLSEVWEERENSAQNRCVEEQVTALTDALGARGAITQRESDSTARVIDRVVEAQGDDAKVAEAFEDYEQERVDIKRDRKNNPFPPFPTGKCDTDQ